MTLYQLLRIIPEKTSLIITNIQKAIICKVLDKTDIPCEYLEESVFYIIPKCINNELFLEIMLLI